MSTILITGAAGFLGHWFASYFINQNVGHDVWLVDNNPRPDSLPMDRQDLGLWLEDFEVDVDLAFHFAAPVGGREKIELDPLFNADSLRLDSLFFRWAVKHAKTAIYPSSSAVYGTEFQGIKPIAQLREELFSASASKWFAPDEMYGFTKLAGERLAWSAAAYGLNTLCIRPFSGYGEGQSFEYPIPSIVRRARNHEDPITIWGPGTQRRDFIHVSDIVGATMARLESTVKGVDTLNIGSGEGTSFNEVARICAEIEGYMPVVTNDFSKPVGVMNRVADIRRMAAIYTPEVSLRDGLERVFAWQEQQEQASAEASSGS